MKRCKSAAAESRPTSRASNKSRSPSAPRPPWRPTTTNDYTHTLTTRADLLARQYIRDGYIPYTNMAQLSNNKANKSNSMATQTLNVENKKVQTGSGGVRGGCYEPKYYVRSYYDQQPAAAAVQHTYGSNKQCYSSSFYALPNIASSSSTTTQTSTTTTTKLVRPNTSAAAGVSFQPKVMYASSTQQAKPVFSFYQVNNGPKHYLSSNAGCRESKSTVNLRPIEATKSGAIYANPTRHNEIHYVSDNARNTWNQANNRNGLVKIHNAGTTFIHD